MLRVETLEDMMHYIFPEGDDMPERVAQQVRRALENAFTQQSKRILWMISEGSSACRERSMQKKRNYILRPQE